MRKMHYNIHCEVNGKTTKFVTEIMLRLYDEYKNDERIFPKEDKEQT